MVSKYKALYFTLILDPRIKRIGLTENIGLSQGLSNDIYNTLYIEY